MAMWHADDIMLHSLQSSWLCTVRIDLPINLIFNHGPRALQGSGNGSTTTMSTRDPSTHIGCRIFWRWINHPIKRGQNWPNSGLSQNEALFFQTSSFCHMWPVKTVSRWSQTHGSCLEIWRWWTLTCELLLPVGSAISLAKIHRGHWENGSKLIIEKTTYYAFLLET